MESDAPTDVPGDARFLTLTDVAEMLNLAVAEVFELVQSGELAAIRVASHWRIERGVLEGYIAGKYEETRRRNAWNQAEFADIPELFADRDRRG